MKFFIVTLASFISLNTYASNDDLIICQEGVRITKSLNGQNQIVVSGVALKQFINSDAIPSQAVNENNEYVGNLNAEANYFVTGSDYGTQLEVRILLSERSNELQIRSIVPCGGPVTNFKFTCY